MKRSEVAENSEAHPQEELVRTTENVNLSKTDGGQDVLPEGTVAEIEEPSKDAALQSKEGEHREHTPTRKVERQGANKTSLKDEESAEKANILEKLSGAAEKKVCILLYSSASIVALCCSATCM